MNGATPVPGPMRINGLLLSEGSLKCCWVRRYTSTLQQMHYYKVALNMWLQHN